MGTIYHSVYKINTQSKEEAEAISKAIRVDKLEMCDYSLDYLENGEGLILTTRTKNWEPTEDIVPLVFDYPTISIELQQTGDHGLAGRWHWFFTIDGKQRIYSLQDAIDEYSVDWAYGVPFDPKQVVVRTRTTTYSWDNSVKYEEYQDVLFPPEEMPENIRLEYEKWCDNQEEWEAEHTTLANKQLLEDNKNPVEKENDELPF